MNFLNDIFYNLNMRVNPTYYKIIYLTYYFSNCDKYISRNGAIEFLIGTDIVDFKNYKSIQVFSSLKSLSRRKISHYITTCIKNEFIDEIINEDGSYLIIKEKGINYLNSFKKELNKIATNKKIEKNKYFYEKK